MEEEILDFVRSKYGTVAESRLSTNDAGVKAVAEAFGWVFNIIVAYRRMRRYSVVPK